MIETVNTAGKDLCHRCDFCYNIIWENQHSKTVPNFKYSNGKYCDKHCAYEAKLLKRVERIKLKESLTRKSIKFELPNEKETRWAFRAYKEYLDKLDLVARITLKRDDFGALHVTQS